VTKKKLDHVKPRVGKRSHWTKNPGSPVRIAAREHEMKALQMRREGFSYPEIASKMGITQAGAFQCVMRVLAAFEDDIKELVPSVRQIELQRLDYYLSKLKERINQGNDKAIGSALRIQERRAKLMGLDAPVEISHSGEIQLIPDDQLDTEIHQLATSLGMISGAVVAGLIEAPEPTTVNVVRNKVPSKRKL